MNLFLWKEELVRDFDTAIGRAQDGAAYLDKKFGPEWDRVLDLERLDIASPFRCVLGQLGSQGHLCIMGPRRSVDRGFSCGILLDCLSLVVRWPALTQSYALLNQAWKAVIRQRRRRSEMQAKAKTQQPMIENEHTPAECLEPTGAAG
jgi:hypothetical protein